MARLYGKLALNSGRTCFILQPAGSVKSTARVSAMAGFLMGSAGFPGEARGRDAAGSCGGAGVYSGSSAEAGRAVLSFHERISSGDLSEIDGMFAFESAHKYWLDITTALGAPCAGVEVFCSEVLALFEKASVREQESSYSVSGIRTKVLGAIGSVVFTKDFKENKSETAVATVALERGGWKVRTYPGVFPGEMLSQVRRSAGGAHERGSQGR